ncbi:MAG: hypothetical protein H0X39_14535 [Actinobacteria bacterium]|nr:hypothetical protein [Actinomycetota bacterium]
MRVACAGLPWQAQFQAALTADRDGCLTREALACPLEFELGTQRLGRVDHELQDAETICIVVDRKLPEHRLPGVVDRVA